MIPTAPSVGIGILNWNGKLFLEKLLPELQLITYPNYTLYVIDNNSSDDSVAFMQASYPSVNIIALDNNYGFATGYNKGFAQMHEDYYLMMNSDVEVPPGFLEPLVAMMLGDETIAICQPKLLSQLEKDTLEHGGAAGGMMDVLGYPFCRGRIFESVEKDTRQYNEPAQIFWASGACNLVRKDAYWKVNGLYSYFFMHSEEIDMCWRLIAEGYKVMYCPQSYIYHLGGGSLSYHSPRKTYLNFRNNVVMCCRNSPWYVNLWLFPLRMILDFVAAIKFLIADDSANSKAVFLAYRDFAKWLLKEKNKFPKKKKSLFSIPFVYHGSIVWQYYIKKIKKYGGL